MCASFIYFAFVAIWSNAIDSAEQRMQFVASINTQVGVLTLGIAADFDTGPCYDAQNISDTCCSELLLCAAVTDIRYPHRAVAQIFGTGWFISRFGETFGLVMVPLVCTSGMMVYANEQQDPPENQSPFFFLVFFGT
jgi:hypothetical protein